jgi:hypothetical protein
MKRMLQLFVLFVALMASAPAFADHSPRALELTATIEALTGQSLK